MASARASSHHSWWELIVIGALALGCLLLTIKAVDIARYDVAILRFPFQVDDAEGVVLAEARLVTQGVNPYAYQPSPAPYFYAGPYTPLYTLLNAGAIAAIGPTFKFGRTVQLLATISVAVWLVWGTRRRMTGRVGWLLGAWIGTLFLTAHLVAVWSVRVRPDMTALAWNLLGVAVLRAWIDPADRTPWREEVWPRGRMLGTLALGAACFAMGWWTKQTFLAVPVAFIAISLIYRPRIGMVLGGLYAAMIAVPFGLLTLVTGGGFAQKVIGYQGSWEWVAYRRLALPFLERYALLIAVAVGAGLYLGIRQRRVRFAVLWVVLSAVVALGAGTSGGYHNHFVELMAASALLIGEGIAMAISEHRNAMTMRKTLMRVGAAAMILVLSVVAVTEREGTNGWLARDYRAPTVSERDGLSAVASFLANHPGLVYSNNVGILVATGQTVRVTDPFTMAAEVRLGRWDDALLVADVVSGRYDVIALSYDVATRDPNVPPTDATPGLIRAIQTRYRLAEKNVLYLYVPK